MGREPEDVPRKRKRRTRSNDAERSLAPPQVTRRKQERVLYVGCEGESTEPDYLDHLVRRFGSGERTGQPFRIVPVYKANGLVPERVVAAVREHAKSDETWALFDRDDHNRIAQAVEDAAAVGTEVCFSHPSFELWLLLHFQAFSGKQSGDSTIVVEKLRAADPAFQDFDKKNGKSVQGPRRAALEGRTRTAIAHAKSLVSQCEHHACKAGQRKVAPVPRNRDQLPQPAREWSARSGHALDCGILNRDPSTDVWRLLVSLGIEDD